MKVVTTIPLLLVLAGGLSAQSAQRVSFQCPGGETLRATIYPHRAIVSLAGKDSVNLKKEAAASGAKYSDGYTVFWEKEGVAMLEAGTGKWQDCKKVESQAMASPLTGKWTLVELRGAPAKSPKPAFIEFAADGKKASGSLGCNRFAGTFAHDGQKLSFGPLAGTKMACIGEANTTEQGFSKALAETQRLQIFEGQLTLLDEMGTKLAVLKKN